MGTPRRQTEILESSLSVEVDFLNLCKDDVHSIENIVNEGNLLNERQCVDLLSKLSKTTRNIQELVLLCGASNVLFEPALKTLFLYLEKAKLLVNQCGEEDWCVAAVFQIQNETAFQEILLDVGLCYNAIYEQARSVSDKQNTLPEDLGQSRVFMPAPESDVREDHIDLQKRLEALADVHGSTSKQCLARYLLVKLSNTDPSQANKTLDSCSAVFWAKEDGPLQIWETSHFLGSGSGASGVFKAKWLGVPCAKKEFHIKEEEPLFLKEAGILAHLRHPYIVNFICCGNGALKGDRFIATELMDMSLYDLIEGQGGVNLSLPVVVDIIVQIARGMCYLHDQGVAHRDLKPQNVVLSRLSFPHLVDHFNVKLVDFGMSKIKVQVSKSNTISIRGVGTMHYRAPEVHPKGYLQSDVGKAVWFKADVFSFAMTCVHILSLKKPFEDIIKMSELYNAQAILGTRPKLPGDCPKELDALLRDCWNTNPRMRPSFPEICRRVEALSHDILRGFPTSEFPRQQKSCITSWVAKNKDVAVTQRPFDATNAVELETTMGTTAENERTVAVEIRQVESDPAKYEWIGTNPPGNSRTNPQPDHNSDSFSSQLMAPPSLLSRFLPKKLVLWVSKRYPPCFLSVDIQEKPFREVQNLMWIMPNPVRSAALEELLSIQVDKLEKRSGPLKNEVYQLVWFFSVFQGVVLTAVSPLAQSQALSHSHVCKQVWSPVLLTALAWVVATVGVWQKLSRIETLECEREDEDKARREVVRRANALRREGEQFKFTDFKVEDPSRRVAPKAFLGYRIWRFWINRFGIVFASLSVFTGFLIASYFSILCSRGLAPIS